MRTTLTVGEWPKHIRPRVSRRIRPVSRSSLYLTHHLFAHDLSPQYKQRPEPMRLVGAEAEVEVETEVNEDEAEGIEAGRQVRLRMRDCDVRIRRGRRSG
jgi:hypothetical protein